MGNPPMLLSRETVQITSHKWEKKKHQNHNKSIPCSAAASSVWMNVERYIDPARKLSPLSARCVQVTLSTWPSVTSGATSRLCLRPSWNATPPCLSATTRERSGSACEASPSCLTFDPRADWLSSPRRWRSYWPSWMWIAGASSWAPAGWERWAPTPSGGGDVSRRLLLCPAGVHEARRAALPGAAEGAAGHRLAGLPAGLLHGTPGPAEVSQAQGETLISTRLYLWDIRSRALEILTSKFSLVFFSCLLLCA